MHKGDKRMGIAASIVSAILKSEVGDKLGSGLAKDLIGISIDGISEKGINEITDFINREKSKIDSILTKENMESMRVSENNIDYVVTEIKELLSKIDITDEVLRKCKYDSMNLSAFLWNKYKECKNDYIEYESEIKQCLFAVAEALIKLVCDSENFEKNILIHINNSVDDTSVELQKIADYMEDNFDKLNTDNQAVLEILQMILEQNQEGSAKNKARRQPVKSRTQEYADKWEANMFLNDFDKRDQNAGTNVKLKEVYLEEHLPHYIWYKNNEIEPSTDIKELLSEYINDKRDRKMLLILGQPGIGKSTLITWITVNFAGRANDILVYKFASDLKNIDWESEKISTRILNELDLKYNDLNGKTLILDGFDEVSIGNNRRKYILNNLYNNWIYDKVIDDFSLIITCRENYVQAFEKLNFKHIILQPWNELQIRSFCNIFQEKTKNSVSETTIKKLLEKKEILGIPLILYMIMALNISIEKEGSIVDVYDKIFSLEGGIYDRCIDNKKFAENHRICNVKEEIHQISKEIAVWMFENEPEVAYIPQKEYEKICREVMEMHQQESENAGQDLLIGNYFKLVKHCEGVEAEELYFIHRTIYEYFVSDSIYSSIRESLINLTTESQKEFAHNIVLYLKKGEVTNTIGEYIKHKIMKLYYGLDNKQQKKFGQWWKETIYLMTEFGMFYFSNKEISNFKNIISKEVRCFLNLLKISQVLNEIVDMKNIWNNGDGIERYIKYCVIELEGKKINLSNFILDKIELKGANLSNAILRGTHLEEAHLEGANLTFADLRGADLRGAYLSGGELRGAEVIKVDLSEADLRGASLAGAVMSKIRLLGTHLDNSIWDEKHIIELRSELKKADFTKIKVIKGTTGDFDLFRRELFK